MGVNKLNTDVAIKIYKEVEEEISKTKRLIDKYLLSEYSEDCLVKIEDKKVKIPVREVAEMLTRHLTRQKIKAKYLKRILDQQQEMQTE